MDMDNVSHAAGCIADAVLASLLEMENLMNHKLINQLTSANVADEDIEELFLDLKFVYENPFDAAIEDAVAKRGCAYVEPSLSVIH
jgi:hypothetical protein